MGPFLTIRRRAVVDLPAPWDPSRVIQEYLDDPAPQQTLALTREQLATLVTDGVRVRIDARHRWMGAMAGEMGIAVQDPLTVEVDIDGWATLPWWLRPFALPFRPRMRRAVNRQIDVLIEELQTDVEEAGRDFADQEAEPILATGDERTSSLERPPPFKGLTWNLKVLTIRGELIYQQAQDGTAPM